MTAYRRLRLPGGSYVFTLCLEERGSSLLTDRIDLLRLAWRDAFRDFPATVQAVVILPDHLHAVLTEPEGSVRFSERWQRLKGRFSHAIADRAEVRPSLARRREAGIWQRRFWEHALRDRAALDEAVAFCRTDPVRHGLVRDPADWPYLTIRHP
ncbi:MAG: transposase [Rhodobacteraceae bacterium]|nr:transposase [Paracoccaceae bacterium]